MDLRENKENARNKKKPRTALIIEYSHRIHPSASYRAHKFVGQTRGYVVLSRWFSSLVLVRI